MRTCGDRRPIEKRSDSQRISAGRAFQTTFPVEGKRVPITSGMSLTAEVKVGKRRVIEFFIYPIIKYLDEGIKVR